MAEQRTQSKWSRQLIGVILAAGSAPWCGPIAPNKVTTTVEVEKEMSPDASPGFRADPNPVNSIPDPVRLVEVDSVEAFQQAITALEPGDHLVLADGEYHDIGDLSFDVSGTSENPIVIRPRNPHQVTITGKLGWRINASHLVFQGLTFDRVKKVPSRRYNSLIDSPYTARHIRFTGCRFLSCETELGENGSVKGTLLDLGGNEHRVDHCFFYDALATVISLRGDRSLMEQRIKGHLRIDHNIFRNMSRLRKLDGQGEALFMGTGFSHFRTQPLGAVVEYNIFDRAIGDTHGEIITVKSSHNTFRYNLFVNGPGAWFDGGSHLSLRHTDSSIVEHNIFQNLGTGIWVTGRHHRITNNHFEDIDFGGLYFPAGNLKDVVDGKSVIMIDGREIMMEDPNAYSIIQKGYGAVFWAAEQCTITDNTFVDHKKFGIYSRNPPDSKHGFTPMPPSDNDISNNVFHVHEQSENAPFMLIDQPDLNAMTGNTFILPETVNPGTLGSDPIIGRPEDLEAALAQQLAWKAKLPPIPPMPGSLEEKPLRAEFRLFAPTAKVGEYLMLDAAFSAGDIVNYKWDFGDGHTAKDSGNTVAHIWSQAGEYEISLTVTDSTGATSTYLETIEVE